MSALTPTTTYPAIVGQVLAKHRGDRNLTQTQLAQALGMKQSAWSKIERGATPLTIEHLAQAADVLEVSPGQILAETDRVADEVRARGVTVRPTRVEADNAFGAGLLLIGAVALGALVAAILMSNGQGDDEDDS